MGGQVPVERVTPVERVGQREPPVERVAPLERLPVPQGRAPVERVVAEML